jgi:hypothetical protein
VSVSISARRARMPGMRGDTRAAGTHARSHVVQAEFVCMLDAGCARGHMPQSGG